MSAPTAPVKRRIVPTFTRTAPLRRTQHLDCTRTALDHTAFPHLLQSIISYSSWPVLLALRATCTVYRDVVDARLFAHVAAGIPAGRRRGRDIELRAPAPPHARLPFLPWQAVEPPGARRAVRDEARKRQIGFVRVLDFGSKWADTELSDTGTPHRYGSDAFEEQEYDDGFDDATTYENTLRAASSLLVPFLRPLNEVPLVVRRRQGVKGIGSVQLHASIYVDYLQMPQTDESARHVELYYSRQTYAIRRMIPPCKEYVLHLSYDPFLPRIWLADHHIALPHTIERVTLVMAPIVHTGPTGMQPDRPLGLLRALLWGFIHYIPNMPLTVVGVENMHPSTLGFPASTEALITPDEAIAMAQQMAAGLVGTFSVDPEPHISGPRGLTNVGWDHHHDVDQQLEALSRLTFLTFEAWEQSLPADSPLVNPPLYEPL